MDVLLKLQQLFKQCTEYEPQQRPTADQVLTEIMNLEATHDFRISVMADTFRQTN
jgi:hypothetical protein